MYRYRKVFFGAKSSPFLLQVVLKHHLEGSKSKSEMVSQLLRNLYMADPVRKQESFGKTQSAYLKMVASTCGNYSPMMRICSVSLQVVMCNNFTMFLGLAGT